MNRIIGSMFCRFYPLVLGTLIAMSTITRAWAQPQPSPAELSDAEIDAAIKLANSGEQKSEAGDHEGALKDFRAADAIANAPTTRAAVATTLKKLGRLVEARERAQSVVDMPLQEGEPPPFTEARSEMRNLVVELNKRIPTLAVKLTGPVVGTARVIVDGTSYPPTPPISLNPGKHDVEVTAPDHEPLRATVDLVEGERATLPAPLEPLGGMEAPPVNPIGDEADGSADISPLLWIGAATAGVGVIVGAVAGSMALSQRDALLEHCTDDLNCPGKQDEIDTLLTTSHVSTTGFAIAGAGAAVGVVGVLLSDFEGIGSQEQAEVQPLLGLGFVGLQGSF